MSASSRSSRSSRGSQDSVANTAIMSPKNQHDTVPFAKRERLRDDYQIDKLSIPARDKSFPC
jgi:hypothetical protein